MVVVVLLQVRLVMGAAVCDGDLNGMTLAWVGCLAKVHAYTAHDTSNSTAARWLNCMHQQPSG